MNKFTKRFVLACFVLFCVGSSGFAQSITMIEEDWELDLLTPNSMKSSPQLVCALSPYANCQSYYATFDINKRSTDGAGGGLQVQLWYGQQLLGFGNFSLTDSLDSVGDRIRWTERLSLSNKGVLTFEIVNGSSQTWPKFPGNGELSVSTNTNLIDLNAYDPNVTAAYSGVDFGNSRVDKLILRKVRTYTSGKKSVERALDRVVYPQ